MKKTIIVSTQPLAKDNHSAFVFIIRYLAEHIPNTVLLDDDFDKFRDNDIDNIIIAYGTFYASFKPIIRFLERYKDKRFFYIVNEYGLVPNGDVYKFLIKHNYELIASYDKSCIGAKHWIDMHSINLHCFVYQDIKNLPLFEQRRKNLIYWGRFREDRINYFKQYFNDIDISTSAKNISLFQNLNQNINIISTVGFNEFSLLTNYKYTLYIEDKYTHNHYCYLATRFYESLAMKLIIFFDKNLKHTIELSGYKIPEFYFVGSRKEIGEKIKQIELQPLKYMSDVETLRQQAIQEQKNILSRFKSILEARSITSDHLCSNCNINAYYLTNCNSCNKVICSSCLEIHKKFYCKECYNNLNLNQVKQTTFD